MSVLGTHLAELSRRHGWELFSRQETKRLLGEGRTEMGKLFKALGIAHPSIGKLPGFEPEPFFQ